MTKHKATKTKAIKRRSAFDGYVQRLHHSGNDVERDATYWGHTLHHEYPVLIPGSMLLEHVHILGGTGTGKTALGISPLMIQLIRRREGPVMVLDLKGDNALFHTARIEAEAAGRKFKWFTNIPGRSTYVFNPWRQAYLEGMAIQEILGLFLLSLNLHHGDDYGRQYFSLTCRTLFQDSLKWALDLENSARQRGSGGHEVPQSFVELEHKIRDLVQSDDEYRAGQQLLHVLKTLVDFPQLNMTPARNPHEPAVQHAIHMPDVIRDNQVVYFFLQALTDVTSVAEIARLAVYSMLSAAVAYREETGQTPRISIITDEAQHLIAMNIANVLAQAREHGVGCIMAHQSMSQLNPPGGVDLRDLFLSCTNVKQFWSTRDPKLKEYISSISGEVNYLTASWPQYASDVSRGVFGRQFAAPKPEEAPVVQIAEASGPRLTNQDLEDYSRQANTSILTIERNLDMCCFQGAFPVHMDWVMPAADYQDRRLKMPWPADSEETIVTQGVWPSMDTTDVSSTDADLPESNDADESSDKQIAGTEWNPDVVEKLDAVRPRGFKGNGKGGSS